MLYAQACIYDKVKRWNWANFILSVVLPVMLSAAAAYNRSQSLIDTKLVSSYLGLYGLLVLAFNIALSSYTEGMGKKAASVQEIYDCRVLGIRRNELKVEEVPKDEISRAAAFFKHHPDMALSRFGSVKCMTLRSQ